MFGGIVQMPKDAKILTVSVQNFALYLWAEIDTDQALENRRIEIFGTGHEIKYDIGISRNFLGTAFLGDFVWHVYEYTGI